MRIVKRILHEPLLHFLLLGSVVFLLYGAAGKRGTEQGKIVVTQAKIEQLVVGFTRAWQRPPTQGELEGLVRDYIREEVYYRQAMTLGLDRDDTVVRRRLRQKMEFLTDDVTAQIEPRDEQLDAYLKRHPDAFRTERVFSFKQVYLNPEHHGKNLDRDAAQILSNLNHANGKADFSAMGDPFLLDYQFDATPESEVSKHFGETFAAKLSELKTGQWHGPIKSGYGAHLVFVSERTEGSVPPLARVRDAVRREWANAQRLEANEQFYRSLLKHYAVVIEQPQQEIEKKVVQMSER